MSPFRLSVLVAMLGVVLSAQSLDVTISPNPAVPGATITISARSALSNVWTPGGCLVTGIRQGSPTGPLVAAFPCTFLGVAVPQCGTAGSPRQSNWTPSASLAPGLYYAQIATTNGLYGPLYPTQYYAITVAAPATTPTLAIGGTASVGAVVPVTLNAPSNASDVFVIAMSGSTNAGFFANGAFISLDYDPLLLASLDGSYPTVFQNFSGLLDAVGASTGVSLAIPQIPGLACAPLFLQGVVIPNSAQAIIPTNVVSFFVN